MRAGGAAPKRGECNAEALRRPMRSLLMGLSRGMRRWSVRADVRRRATCGIAIHKPAPASPVEGLPLTFGLSQPVSDRIEGGRMSAKAEVA